MPLPLNRAGNTSTDGSPQLKREVRRNGKKNKSRKVKAFRRNAYKVKNPRITPKGVGKPDGGNLSSRKIVWLEKLKHYLNIGACNFQLKLHLYSGQEGRESLKGSKDHSRHALSILKHGETRQSNLSKAKEDFEDGQYVNAAHKFGEAGIAGFKEGKSRAWTWLRA